jgi:hypothetical protein
MSYIIDAKSDLVTTVHDAITASVTSANTTPVDCTNFNGVLVYIDLSSTGSPDWTIDIESSDTKTGTYADCYDYTTLTPSDDTPVKLTTGSLTEDRVCLFKGIGNWVKAVPTENGGTGTCTVKLQPLNI